MSDTYEDLPITMIAQFPHCDSRVLHAPRECEYCDEHPDWQELRRAWAINFTGHHLEATEYGGKYLPCPSEANRPLSLINQWDGNVPFKGDKINTDSPVFPKGADVIHNVGTRHVIVGIPVEITAEGAVIEVNDLGNMPAAQTDFDAVAEVHDRELEKRTDEIDKLIYSLKKQLDNLGKIVKGLLR